MLSTSCSPSLAQNAKSSSALAEVPSHLTELGYRAGADGGAAVPSCSRALQAGALSAQKSAKLLVAPGEWHPDYNHSPLGRLTRIKQGAKSPTTFAYFEPKGELQSVVSALPGAPSGYSGVTTYTHDYKGQLLSEVSTRNGGYNNRFGYDNAGNPTTFRGTAHTFNANNQDISGSYDNNGSPYFWNGVAAYWDQENRLSGLNQGTSYWYSGDGLL
ncbi:MAG TPA: hypothetical protein VGS41_00195, partial [Chthonomonadales bacterium]|nr:hypothetical protein [Chthonomonadales bacterium]